MGSGGAAMYVHHTRRTQLYLDHELHARLKALARRRGRSVSELVREALVQVDGPSPIEQQLRTTEATAGLWRDRDDLGDTDEYLRQLRRGTHRMPNAGS